MNIKIAENGIWVSQATKDGYIFCEWGGVFDISYPDSKLRRGRVQGGGQICPTLTSSGIAICRVEKRSLNGSMWGESQDTTQIMPPTLRSERTGLLVMEQIRIRKLTPTECFRLMGFTDEDIKRCQAVGMSNSQLYKQAGNSIVVSVLEAIFGQMFEGKEEEWKKHW